MWTKVTVFQFKMFSFSDVYIRPEKEETIENLTKCIQIIENIILDTGHAVQIVIPLACLVTSVTREVQVLRRGFDCDIIATT